MPFAPIQIPPGASFKDMVALKGQADIGDRINKKIIAPLASANKLADMPDFNDATKLGSGKEMVDRLTNLIAIFENKALDFSKSRADGDDILGDAYENQMRHFATESGKSKGQFYTPAEVSRIMARIIGIGGAGTSNDTTVYDPTCGSSSLLLKVGDEAKANVTLYGQEKDAGKVTETVHLSDPAYFEKMSALLDEIIRLRKEKAIEYEEYLKRIAALATSVQAGKTHDAPEQLNTPGRLALYNNLKAYIAANQARQPCAPYADQDAVLTLALQVDEVVKKKRPDGWRGVPAREQMVKQALDEALKDVDQVNRLYPIIYAQKEY